MIEIPESKTISSQVGTTLLNKTICEVINATSPHKFAWFYGDPEQYPKLLIGKQIIGAKGYGMFIDICCDNDIYISISDGTNIRYCQPYDKRPEKHQLLIVFDDHSYMSFTVAMYGAIYAYKGTFENKYYQNSINSISPLDDAFNEVYFDNIFKNTTKDLSIKALLATEQRIPGLGNGVLQDILFNAAINPKRKKSTVTDFQKSELFHSIKVTLNNMTNKGGRDTEKDFFGQFGGYKTILSKNTVKDPCPNCGSKITKEPYLGGAIYYCPSCQKL